MNVNYHVKLADDFEKLEQIFKEHYSPAMASLQLVDTSSTTMATPKQNSYLNTLISNQYLSKQNLVTPSIKMSRDTSRSDN